MKIFKLTMLSIFQKNISWPFLEFPPSDFGIETSHGKQEYRINRESEREWVNLNEIPS